MNNHVWLFDIQCNVHYSVMRSTDHRLPDAFAVYAQMFDDTFKMHNIMYFMQFKNDKLFVLPSNSVNYNSANWTITIGDSIAVSTSATSDFGTVFNYQLANFNNISITNIAKCILLYDFMRKVNRSTNEYELIRLYDTLKLNGHINAFI